MLAIFLELDSEGLHQSSGKEKESCCLVFPSSTKREISHFHVVVVQRRQRNVQKSVMNVQSCCFANINPFALLPFLLPSPSSLLKLPFVECPPGFKDSAVRTELALTIDCQTVGFFLRISKEMGKAWRKSLARAKRASLTRPKGCPKGVCGERIFSFSPQSRSVFSVSYRTFCLTASA